METVIDALLNAQGYWEARENNVVCCSFTHSFIRCFTEYLLCSRDSVRDWAHRRVGNSIPEI